MNDQRRVRVPDLCISTTFKKWIHESWRYLADLEREILNAFYATKNTVFSNAQLY